MQTVGKIPIVKLTEREAALVQEIKHVTTKVGAKKTLLKMAAQYVTITQNVVEQMKRMTTTVILQLILYVVLI